MEHEGDGYTICKWRTRNNTQSHVKGTRRFRNQRTNGYPNYSIIKISQNTKKSPGDLRRLAATHSSEKLSASTGMKNSHYNNK